LKGLPKGLIIGYVHDNDATTRKIMLESGLGLTEYLDPGHARKAIIKAIKTANTREKVKNPKTGRQCGAMGGLKGTIINAFNRVRRNNTLSPQQKYQAILDVEPHICGDHTNCTHKLLPEEADWPFRNVSHARNVLRGVLLTVALYASKASADKISTQPNESFHERKRRYAPKGMFRKSNKARMDISVLCQNNPDGFRDQLRRKCGLGRVQPGVQRVQAQLSKEERKSRERSTTEAALTAHRAKRRKQRGEWHDLEKQQTEYRAGWSDEKRFRAFLSDGKGGMQSRRADVRDQLHNQLHEPRGRVYLGRDARRMRRLPPIH
jgi:hypothetical protein